MELRQFGQYKRRTWYVKKQLKKDDYVVLFDVNTCDVVVVTLFFLNNSRYFNPWYQHSYKSSLNENGGRHLMINTERLNLMIPSSSHLIELYNICIIHKQIYTLPKVYIIPNSTHQTVN